MKKSFALITVLLVAAVMIMIAVNVGFADLVYLRTGHDILVESITLNGDTYSVIDCDGEARSITASLVSHVIEDIDCNYDVNDQVEFYNQYGTIENWENQYWR